VTMLRAQRTGFESRQDFLFSETSRPTMGPTRPPMQYLPEALSPGVKLPGCEADHLVPTSAEVKNDMRRYTSSPPICLHGVDRTTLPFTVSVYLWFI
jgi:hypothetical protein